MEPDFSGYATKAGLKCTDGRTIMPDAFKHQDKVTVPLVWQHGHDSVENVLGHAVLEARADGIYTYGYFNQTKQGQSAKALVQHGDIKKLSIYANKLVERSKQVLHGFIHEVSLVLSGANPGAFIDNVSVQHSDGEVTKLDDEAIIYTGLALEHADASPGKNEGDNSGTVQDVYDTLSDKQKDVVSFMLGSVIEKMGVEHSAINASETENADDKNKNNVVNHKEGANEMNRNVFDQTDNKKNEKNSLTHDQLKTIVEDAKRLGSFKESFLSHAVEYGIENIDYLFPDAKTLANAPEMVTRKQEWVSIFWNGLKKNPFSRIKTISADLTLDEARAKGYVKGTMKKDEWFTLSQRVTTPTTIYKKQKLDRDDIVDITDLDVVAWLKAEMRIMLDEEIARAALLGDGREVDDEDKINENHIRPIAFEDDFYAEKVTIPANVAGDALVEAVLRARPKYRGAGNPTAFMTEDLLTDLILVKDKMGRRLYPTQGDVAAALRVSAIVTVPPMDNVVTDNGALLMILVNPNDYVVGADKGGAVSMFDDFDIDYNQYKYLIETRISGALTKFKTALIFTRATGAVLVTPGVPTFVPETGVVTIPNTANVSYFNQNTDVELTAGAQTALEPGATLSVEARADEGYYLAHNTDNDWDFTRPLA